MLYCEECGQTVAEEALPLRCGIPPQETIVVLLFGSGLKTYCGHLGFGEKSGDKSCDS